MRQPEDRHLKHRTPSRSIARAGIDAAVFLPVQSPALSSLPGVGKQGTVPYPLLPGQRPPPLFEVQHSCFADSSELRSLIPLTGPPERPLFVSFPTDRKSVV